MIYPRHIWDIDNYENASLKLWRTEKDAFRVIHELRIMNLNIMRLLLFASVLSITISCKPNKSNSNKSLATFQKAEVEILSLLPTPDPKNISLTLGLKSDTTFKLKMIIGEYDAQALAIILKGLKPRAPLPLDLLEDAIKKFEYHVQEVVIDSLKNDYYTAKIICYNDRKTVELKARPVDALAVASKFNSPILVNIAFLTK